MVKLLKSEGFSDSEITVMIQEKTEAKNNPVSATAFRVGANESCDTAIALTCYGTSSATGYTPGSPDSNTMDAGGNIGLWYSFVGDGSTLQFFFTWISAGSRNAEFGMRNSEFQIPSSKFRVPNSEFRTAC